MTTRVEGYSEVFRAATGRGPFPYQRRLAEDPDLPTLVRAPTGAGKTAAAVLGWLHRRRFHPDPGVREATPRRLVYCLPMRVLVEQTLRAVRDWIRKLGLEEEVGVFQLMGGALEHDWVRVAERDAVLVGTMDMLLSRALNRGYVASRFRWPMEFGLLNNDCLWVLDEVQLMGNGLAASTQLAGFRRLLGTARPCPSLWMSATAAREWLATADHDAPQSVLTIDSADLAEGLGARVRAHKRLEALQLKAWPRGGADAILKRHRPGTLTLIVVNTVERALELGRQLRKAAPRGTEILVVHSRFRPPDRRTIVKRLRSSPPAEGRVVVATQVVEAGVDVSAATLVTELAPWGSLVQRFGRCNRFGELAEATAIWIDLPEDQAPPYDPEDLGESRDRLRALEGGSVSPGVLEGLGPERPPTTTHILRRVDLIDLFDTEPDLGGNQVDVSRFIRDDADVDAQVFWRRWEGPVPPPEERQPVSEELCPVPVGEVRAFLRGSDGRGPAMRAFAWDHLDRAWREVGTDDVHPGMALLLPAEAGCYSAESGWDRRVDTPVEPWPQRAGLVEEDEGEALGGDPPQEVMGARVPLADHLAHVRDRVHTLLADIAPELTDWERDALLAAALWHDVGKAHEQFQRALLMGTSEEERDRFAAALWAKLPHRPARYERPHFRHELASALALLAAPATAHGLNGQALDLAAYLVAAHHGKVRLAIRSLDGEQRPRDGGRRFARGVWDGDALGPVPLDGVTLPRIELDLSVMEIGRGPDGRPSWVERALGLRDTLGPFRLAFLEALLRVADWEASAEESRGSADA
ncbi:MAG TPA: CRISPR-associated helicase Cas3' [bacterium]|nr:CRISPR-associated helicase Cas3' [bacterium]